MTKVFLDTNMLKFSATSIERLIRVNKPTRNAQGEVTGLLLYEPGYINPNEKIQDKRYRTLAKIAGAYQVDGKSNLNQLRDAFYVWCPEHNGCE